MNEKLISKIKTISGLTEAADEKVLDNFAQNLFSKHGLDKKIKIEDLGSFQIEDDPGSGEKLLIYDAGDETEIRSIPVHIKDEEDQFNDKLFSFSFGKPIINVNNSDKINNQKDVREYLEQEKLDKGIKSFLEGSEKIEEEYKSSQDLAEREDEDLSEAETIADDAVSEPLDTKDNETEKVEEIEKAQEAAEDEAEISEEDNLVTEEEDEELGEADHEEKLEEETGKVLEDSEVKYEDFEEEYEEEQIPAEDEENEESVEEEDYNKVLPLDEETEEGLTEEINGESSSEIEDMDTGELEKENKNPEGKGDITESDFDLVDAELESVGIKPVKDEEPKTFEDENQSEEIEQESTEDKDDEEPENLNKEFDEEQDLVDDDTAEDAEIREEETNWEDELKDEFDEEEEIEEEDDSFVAEDFTDQSPDELAKNVEEEKKEDDNDDHDKIVATAAVSQDEKEEILAEEAKPEIEEKSKAEKTYSKKKKGLGFVFWGLLSAFIIVLVGGIYFFFFLPESSDNIQESNLVENSEQNIIQNEPETPAASNEGASTEDSEAGAVSGDVAEMGDEAAATSTENEDQINSEESPVKETGQSATQKISGSYYRDIPNETSMGGYVYYDGEGYNVQVASYKSQTSAEQHVMKLREAGLNAFIVKDYLERIGGDWFRVRVGFFDTEEAARKFQGN